MTKNDCRLGERSRQDENKGPHSGDCPKLSTKLVGSKIRLRQRTGEWITHTFREHNKEADLWADKGEKGRVEEWVDTTRVAWPEVAGLCGFWDGSCDNGYCGSGILIMAYSDLQGWSTFYEKCGLVPGKKSLDAEMGGC